MFEQNQQFVSVEEFNRLKSLVENLSQSVYKNNFSSSQTFTKDAIFQTRLQVPSYTDAPSVAEVNDIIGINGTLWICTVAGDVANRATFTLVGTQS